MEEGCRGFDSCDDVLTLLDSPNTCLWVPPFSFHETMLNTGQEPQRKRANPKRKHRDIGQDTDGEESDPNPYYQSEKKRRLTIEQVEYLEKSFETENKLDQERKEKLAKKLGLESKQVAIWFQNRRARYKNKQIEKDYDALKAKYDCLKYDYDSLIVENEKLQNEVDNLKNKLGQKDINQNNSNPQNTVVQSIEGLSTPETYETIQTRGLGNSTTQSYKHVEDASSAKSDVLNSESPLWTNDDNNNNHTSTLLEASSNLVRGPDQKSDLSVDYEEHFLMNESLLLPQISRTLNNFLKVEDVVNYDPSNSSCNFSLLDDQPFWSRLY